MTNSDTNKVASVVKRRANYKSASTDAGQRLAMFAQQDAALMTAFGKIPQSERLFLIRMAEAAALEHAADIHENRVRHIAQFGAASLRIV